MVYPARLGTGIWAELRFVGEYEKAPVIGISWLNDTACMPDPQAHPDDNIWLPGVRIEHARTSGDPGQILGSYLLTPSVLGAHSSTPARDPRFAGFRLQTSGVTVSTPPLQLMLHVVRCDS